MCPARELEGSRNLLAGEQFYERVKLLPQGVFPMREHRLIAILVLAMASAGGIPARALTLNYEPFELGLGDWESQGVAAVPATVPHSGLGVAHSSGPGAHAIQTFPPHAAGAFTISMFDDLAGCANEIATGEKVQFAVVRSADAGSPIGIGINTVEQGNCLYAVRFGATESSTLIRRTPGWNQWTIAWDSVNGVATVSVNGVVADAVPYTYVPTEAAFGSMWAGLPSTPTDYDDAMLVRT
jgi:hypothetical protein